MRLYFYRGLDHEKVSYDVTHVIVDNSVTIIKEGAFSDRIHLVSIIMGDNVKRIEKWALHRCKALRFIRLSKTLEYIEAAAFGLCCSVEALFLPSTVQSIGYNAFVGCLSLRLLILPNGIDLSNVGDRIIKDTMIHHIAGDAGVEYEMDCNGFINDESNRQVNEWLVHYMDEAPFHTLCYNSSVTTEEINDHLIENGNDSTLQIDSIHGTTPLHILTMNPHASADSIVALIDSNIEAALCDCDTIDSNNRSFSDNTSSSSGDDEDKGDQTRHIKRTPLNHARNYNVGGLVSIISLLCSKRNST